MGFPLGLPSNSPISALSFIEFSIEEIYNAINFHGELYRINRRNNQIIEKKLIIR
jgi:hypothetical protein